MLIIKFSHSNLINKFLISYQTFLQNSLKYKFKIIISVKNTPFSIKKIFTFNGKVHLMLILFIGLFSFYFNYDDCIFATSSMFTFFPKKRFIPMIKIKSTKVIKRHMFRNAANHSTHLLQTKRFIGFSNNPYSTTKACKFKGKAAKDLSNDGGKKNHTHVVEEKCAKDGCSLESCPKLCGIPKGFRVIGHNTHKPPIGRLARFIDEKDANGADKPQYFVPTNTKKEVSQEEREKYPANEIKEDPKQQSYVDDHLDKFK